MSGPIPLCELVELMVSMILFKAEGKRRLHIIFARLIFFELRNFLIWTGICVIVASDAFHR